MRFFFGDRTVAVAVVALKQPPSSIQINVIHSRFHRDLWCSRTAMQIIHGAHILKGGCGLDGELNRLMSDFF
jgi:hypothetical protein